MKSKIKIIIVFLLTMLIILFGKNVVNAYSGEKYVTGEKAAGAAGPSTRTDSDGNRTYNQRSTGIVDTIFTELKTESNIEGYFSKHEATNQYAGSTIEMAYTQSMKLTDVAYCVNKGAHINSKHRWLYHIYGYIEIEKDTVYVYTYKNGGGYDKTEYSDTDTVQLAQYLAAAVSVNGPYGGYTESGTDMDGNAGTTTNKKNSELGYGDENNYNPAQLMVYYYWNQSNLLDNLGVSYWKHKQGGEYDKIQSKIDSERSEFEQEVDMGGKKYKAQILYMSGYSKEDSSKTLYEIRDGLKEPQKVNWKETKGLQELILAVGNGEIDDEEEDGGRGFKLTIKKEWNYNGTSKAETLVPNTITISIYKKDGNKFVGTTTINKQLKSSESGSEDEYEWIGTYAKLLSGKKEDYTYKEGKDSGWSLEKTEYLNNNDSENEETVGKYGNRYPSESQSNENATANSLQKKIAEVAKSAGENGNFLGQKTGWCLAWAQQVYAKANAPYQSGMLNARNAGVLSGISSDFSYVPVGAVIYGYGNQNSKHGHCGIYIGNGKVAHLASKPGIMALENWIKTYRGACWGWLGGDSQYIINSKFTKASYPLMSTFSSTYTDSSGQKRIYPKVVSDEEIEAWTQASLGHEFSTDIITSLQVTVKITNKYTPTDNDKDKGKIKISGKVFIDEDTNKAGVSVNGIDDEKDRDKSGIGDIKVTWRTKSGIIISSTKTAADGTWNMETKVNLWLRKWDKKYLESNPINWALGELIDFGPGELYFFDEDRFNEVNDSYVEFEYNGYEYTTTKRTDNAVNEEYTSKAETSDIERIILDSKFNEITTQGVTTTDLVSGISNILLDDSIGDSIRNLLESDDSYLDGSQNSSELNKVIQSLGSKDSLIGSITGGLSDKNNALNDYNNNNSNFYRKMLENLKFGSTISKVLDSLNNIGDESGLGKLLELIGEYLGIKSQEEGVANQILDIFNIKGALDTIQYVGNDKTEHNKITYKMDDDGNAIPQAEEKSLNTYTIKASTKGIVQKMLTGYKFSKSSKHARAINFCDAPNSKEYIGQISSKYDTVSVMFESDIKEKTHGSHAAFSNLSSVLGQLGISSDNLELMDELENLFVNLNFFANPNVSSGSIYSFWKPAWIQKALNSHTDLSLDNANIEDFLKSSSVNCNGFTFKNGSKVIWAELIKKLAIVLSDGALSFLENINVYKVPYTVGTKVKHAYNIKQMTDTWEITNINCGLTPREQPDAMLKSDILQARVVMNGQEYTYNYNLRNYDLVDAISAINAGVHAFNVPVSNGDKDLITNEDINKLKLITESITGQYTRKINPANISYVNSNITDREKSFEIYVTYWIQAGNQSNTLPMRINKIVNYYENDCYTYSDDYSYKDDSGNEYKNSDYGWHKLGGSDGNIVSTTGSYNCVVTNILGKTWILPTSKSKKIPLTYKVDLSGNTDVVQKLMLNKKLLINNISEIASYTTRYGLNTMCLNGQSAIMHPWMLLSGYAGVDRDSQPGDAIINVITGVSKLLKEHGIDTDFYSDRIDQTTENILQQLNQSGGNNSGLSLDFLDKIIGSKDEIAGKVSDSLKKLIATNLEDYLNKIANEITDKTGLNIYNLLQKVEDDTSMAPLFKLDLTEDNQLQYRTISGAIFEDENTEERSRLRERVGNGNYDQGTEKGVNGVRVELHRIDNDGNDQGIATIYGISDDGKESTISKAVTYTDENGKYSFGDGTKCGVIEDRYKIYYIYGDGIHEVPEYKIDTTIGEGGKNVTDADSNEIIGKVEKEPENNREMHSTINNHEIDGRNYKSTIITNETVKGVFDKTNSENADNWHIIVNGNTSSMARDLIDDNDISKNYTQRNDITSLPLQYNNYEKKNNMTACTNSFKLGIEYVTDSKKQVNRLGDPQDDSKFIDNISLNFGIIERAREDIIVDKTISNIKMLFANGQVLFDGDPYSGELPYLIALGPKTNRASSDNNTRDRLIRIEMDTELMQSAELQITYKISVTNNSEIDYNTKDYYYYGIAGTKEELVTGCVPLLVDYLDSECEFVDNDINQRFNWKVKSIEDLTGLISEYDAQGNVKNAIQEGKYTILTTDYFTNVGIGINETKSATLYVTKLLSTKADEYTFENHTEILQIDGNRARTIKEVDDRTREQVTKEYKPGNYMPSTKTRNDWKKDNTAHISKVGMHEQDDDRITIRITPPTGVITRNGYIAIMIVSLLVIGLGAFAIKKKVLNK